MVPTYSLDSTFLAISPCAFLFFVYIIMVFTDYFYAYFDAHVVCLFSLDKLLQNICSFTVYKYMKAK